MNPTTCDTAYLAGSRELLAVLLVSVALAFHRCRHLGRPTVTTTSEMKVLPWAACPRVSENIKGKLARRHDPFFLSRLQFEFHLPVVRMISRRSNGFVVVRFARWLVRSSAARARRLGCAPGSKVDRRPRSLSAAEPCSHRSRWRAA